MASTVQAKTSRSVYGTDGGFNFTNPIELINIIMIKVNTVDEINFSLIIFITAFRCKHQRVATLLAGDVNRAAETTPPQL